jgi:hypothetical protein
MNDSRKETGSGPKAALPGDGDPLTVWVGPSSGAFCEHCQRAIAAGEIEYEVCDAARPACGRSLKFHIGCHAAWCAVAGRLR